MKVNIQKEGEEVKQFNLINNWEDVSLETYGKLLDFKEGNKSQEALHLIEAMTDIPKKYAELWISSRPRCNHVRRICGHRAFSERWVHKEL